MFFKDFNYFPSKKQFFASHAINFQYFHDDFDDFHFLTLLGWDLKLFENRKSTTPFAE